MAKQKTQTVMKKKTKFKEVHISKLYRLELEKIEKKYNGMISPQIVVEEAKDEKNPLHKWFNWDDSVAGEKWRLHQARLLINSIRVKIDFDKGTSTYRKYLNVFINNSESKDPQRYYVNTKTVLKNENLKQQILIKAMKEIEYWEKTYKEYNELNEIFNSIKRTKNRIGKIDISNNNKTYKQNRVCK